MRLRPSHAVCLGIGALAYPLGIALTNVLDHRGLLYPKEEKP